MGRVIGFLFSLVIVLFGLSFALLNAQPVELDYYFGQTGMPLSLVIVLAVIVGAVLGVIASLGVILRQRRALARLRRSLGASHKESTDQRKLPLKDVPA